MTRLGLYFLTLAVLSLSSTAQTSELIDGGFEGAIVGDNIIMYDPDSVLFLTSPFAPVPPISLFGTGGGGSHCIARSQSDNGFPTQGDQYCDMSTLYSYTPGCTSGFLCSPNDTFAPSGLEQSFTLGLSETMLHFDAAFMTEEWLRAPNPLDTEDYNDFMRVYVTDGTTEHTLYYADLTTPRPQLSVVHGGSTMSDITSVSVNLNSLYPGAAQGTVVTFVAVVQNDGDELFNSNGYLDNISVDQQIVLTDGTTILEDFEDGPGGYSVHFGVWEHGVPANNFITGAASGTKAWVTGLASAYPNNANARLVSPLIDCTALSEDPIISFKQIFDIEGFFDIVRLEMSVDGGVYFPVGAQGDAGNWFNQGPGGVHGEGWNGTSGPAGAWRTAGHILDGAAGHVIRLLFRLRTDGSVQREGMGIDDIVLSTNFGGQASRPGVATLDMLSASFGRAVNSSLAGVEVGLPGPYEISAQAGIDWLNLYFEGTPNDPILLVAGPLNVAEGLFSSAPGNQIDLGTAPTYLDVSIIGNGLDPGFFNAQFHLNSSGSQSLSFGTLPMALAGYQAAFQAFYLGADFKATNAVVLSIE